MQRRTWISIYVMWSFVLFGCSAAPEPHSIMGQELVGDCSVQLTTYPTTTQNVGSSIPFDASSTCIDGTSEYKYYLRKPNGSWIIARDWDASNTFSWDSTGGATGTYNVQVWVRRQGQTVAYEGASISRSFTLTGAAADSCHVELTTYPTQQQAKWGLVPLAATGSCTSGTPEYKYYLRKPNGSWIIARDWDVSDTFSWDSANQPTGMYLVQVWIRRQGQTVSQEDASTTRSFELADRPSDDSCQLSLSTYPTQQQTQGAAVSFVANGSCVAGAPEYKYYLRQPNGSWIIARDWDLSGSFSWDSTSQATGSYDVQVWLRRRGNNVTYQEASIIRTFTLTPSSSGGSCSGASVSYTHNAGIYTFQFTPTCTGGATAEYKIYRSTPVSNYTLARDWSTSNTYVLDTTQFQTGVYSHSVWIRAQGSTATHEGFQTMYFPVGKCSQPVATPNPLSPVTEGSTVTWSFTSSCDPKLNPEYRLLHRPPGGTWTTLHDWGDSGQLYSWSTTGAATGNHEFQLLVRAAQELQTYESSSLIPYQVNAPTPGNATVRDFDATGLKSIKHISLDASGNTYLSGTFKGTATFGSTTLTVSGEAGFLAKMNAQGQWVWARSFVAMNLSVGSFEYIASAEEHVVDHQGNVYLTGFFLGSMHGLSAPNGSIYIAKINAQGTLSWIKSFGVILRIAGFTNNKLSLVGSYLSPVTLGSSSLPHTGSHAYGLAGQMDTSGQWLWATHIVTSEAISIVGASIDANNNTYIYAKTGTQATFGSISVNSSSQNYIAKVDASGSWKWVTPHAHSFYSECLTTTPSGDVYIAGYFQNSRTMGSTTLTAVGTKDLYVAKLDTNGSYTWAVSTGGVSSTIGPKHITTDSQGNVYLTGYFKGTVNIGSTSLTESKQSWVLAKLSASGTWQHAQKVTSSISLEGQYPLNSGPELLGLYIDANSMLHVYGTYSETLNFGTYTLQKSASGFAPFLWSLPAP